MTWPRRPASCPHKIVQTFWGDWMVCRFIGGGFPIPYEVVRWRWLAFLLRWCVCAFGGCEGRK